jgi:hypothetical protein
MDSTLVLLALFSFKLVAQTPAQGHTNSWYNADSSPKLAMEFGGGYSASAGSSRQAQDDGWNYLMGGGYNFNRRLSLLAEYGFNHFRAPQSEVDALFGAQPTGPGTSQVVGDTHLWKLTLDPSYRYHQTEHLGLYVVAGGGFFRKLQIFRTEYNACINSCGPPTSDLLRASNNAGGIEGGAGASWRPGTYSNARLFAEVRYVWVDNKPGLNDQFYAPADGATHYLPITAGLRW